MMNLTANQIGIITPRVCSKLAYDQTTGCWLWTGVLSSHGYGFVRWHGKMVSVHRLVYRLLRGEINDGLQVDHLCRNRKCANPSHMELVTNRENVLRGNGPTATNARKDSCKNGHTYSEDTTYYRIRRGCTSRCCKICDSETDAIKAARGRK